MYRELTGQGVRIPNGFATTADAFRQLLPESGVGDRVIDLLDGLDANDVADL
jgi:pyruvate,water dikinase